MPPPSFLATLINKCTTITSLKAAGQLHALILLTTNSTSYAKSPYLNNNLLSMYARCGSLSRAQLLFDKMPLRNLVSYNALIAAYSRDTHHGFFSFKLLAHMGIRDLRPNSLTFTSLLQACCSLMEWFMGCLIHAQVVKFGFVNDVCVQTSLLGMYSSCADLESAQKVFGCVTEKDVVLLNSMILGNLKNAKIKEALFLFSEMVSSSVSPTKFTYSMVLSACGKLGDYSCGQAIHARVLISSVLADLPLQNALLDMYWSCGDKKSAFTVFRRIENPGLVSWNSMISGCAENEEGEEAMHLFVHLQDMSPHKPDEYTFAAVVSATSELPAIHYGKPLHAHTIRAGFERRVFIGSTLQAMYFKNGDAVSAEEVVFHSIEEKDVVLWTEMIMGHTRLGDGEAAIELFCKMHLEGHKTDSFALSGALSACADLATLKQGKMIHSQVIKTGCNSAMSVRGSLVDMYAKNGNLQDAQLIFAEVINPDLKCWNAMIGACSQHGMAEESMTLFRHILEHRLIPDQVTFLSMLSSCDHSGLVERGKFFWNYMKENGIIPGPKHFSCMISLLSRAGLLDEAEKVATEATTNGVNNLEVWRTLLSSCVNGRNLRLGVRAAEEVLRLDPEDSATHVLLSNLYAATGRWDFVAGMRRKMRGLMVEKDPGLSWIEAKNGIHIFSSGDQSNPLIDEALTEVHRLQGNMMKFDKCESIQLWQNTF